MTAGAAPVSRLMGWILALLWPFTLLHILTGAYPPVTAAATGLFLVYLLLALATMHMAARALSLLLVAATAAVAWTDGTWDQSLSGFQGAMVFAAFLPSIFLLRNAFAGDTRLISYRDAVAAATPEQQKGQLLVGSHVLGSTLTVGAFAILAPVIPGDASAAHRRDLAVAAIFGVGLSVVWSPAFVAMAVVTDFMPDVALWKLVLLGLLMAAIGIGLAMLRVRTPQRLRLVFNGLWMLRHVVPWVALAACVIILASAVANVSTLVAASLTLPPLAALMLALQPGAIRRAALVRTRGNLDNMGAEISIVALAFTLGAVMLASPTVQQVVAGFLGPGIPSLLLIAGIVAIMMAVVLVGGHPIVIASILLAVFASADTGLDSLFVAAAVLLGWGCGSMIAPAGLIIIVSTSMFNVTRRDVILSRHAWTLVAFASAGIALLTLLDAVF